MPDEIAQRDPVTAFDTEFFSPARFKGGEEWKIGYIVSPMEREYDFGLRRFRGRKAQERKKGYKHDSVFFAEDFLE